MYVVVILGNPRRQHSKAGRPSNLQCGQTASVTRSSAVNVPTPRCFPKRPWRSRVWASPFPFPRLLLVLCAADMPWRIGGGSFPQCLFSPIPVGNAPTLAPPATLAAPASRCRPRNRSRPLRPRLPPPPPPAAPVAAGHCSCRPAGYASQPPQQPPPLRTPPRPVAAAGSIASRAPLCLCSAAAAGPTPPWLLPPPPAPPLGRRCGPAAATAHPPPVAVVTAASVAHRHFCFSMNALLWRCSWGERMHAELAVFRAGGRRVSLLFRLWTELRAVLRDETEWEAVKPLECKVLASSLRPG